MKIVSTKEHYDLLIEEGNDPYDDPPLLQEYMSNWDGPNFYKALDVKDKVVLEIGIGTGRLAKKMLLSGCKKFVGIDISLKTLNRAKDNLVDFSNAEFELVDVIDYVRPDFFDYAYSVLTFLHIEDKERAFNNIYKSLKSNGTFVLSVSNDGDWLEIGNDRKIKLYPLMLDDYLNLLTRNGFIIQSVHETESKFATIIKGIKP